jgi:molybdopterin synthase catalytic subunit
VKRIAIVDRAIDLDALHTAVRHRGAGAVVTFLGTTRNENDGRRVMRLEYEAYGRMAEREMRQLAVAAAARWPIKRVAMAHRTGSVPVGEASVAIAVSAPHRTEAFAACHWLIDRLKEIVPIWKKEHYRGGQVWIGPQRSSPASPRRGGRAAKRPPPAVRPPKA